MISDNIRYLRNKKGISQTALADAIGLKRGNIASYEKGLAQPNIESLLKLADYFGVDLNMMLKEDISQQDTLKERRESSHSITDNFNLKGLKDRIQSLKGTKDSLSQVTQLKNQNADIKKMLEGFKSYQQFRMDKLQYHKDNELLKLATDYDKLLELLETVLQSNKELITLVGEQQ